MIDPIASTSLSLDLSSGEPTMDLAIQLSGLKAVDQLLAEHAPQPASAAPAERRKSTRRPQENAVMLHAVLHAINQGKPRADLGHDRPESCLTTQSYQQF